MPVYLAIVLRGTSVSEKYVRPFIFDMPTSSYGTFLYSTLNEESLGSE